MAEPKGNRNVLFYENSTMNLKLVEIGYNDFRQKIRTKLFHTRNEYIIHYVRNGKGFLHIEDKLYMVGTGEFFLIPPNIPVKYYHNEADPWRYYWFSLSGDAAQEISALLNLSADSPIVKAISPQNTIRIFDDLFQSKANNTQLYYLALSALMQILSVNNARPTNLQTVRNITETTARIKEIIELNYDDPDFSVEAVSKLLYISHSYMCKVFKEQVGCTPVSYLIDVRLQNAAEKLNKRNYSVKELCEAVGFRDEPYFMKRFKQRFGVTIREYRKKFSK